MACRLWVGFDLYVAYGDILFMCQSVWLGISLEGRLAELFYTRGSGLEFVG